MLMRGCASRLIKGSVWEWCKLSDKITVYRISESLYSGRWCRNFEKMSFNYYEAASHAEIYNKFRPSPPQELAKRVVEYLAEKVSPPFEAAIDVGCGGGQSTKILTPFFKEVVGFDPSESQIKEAKRENKLQNVAYRVGSAEKIDCPDSSIQLVTAGQACHWFDLPKFYAEVERVLVPGGVLVLYGYLLPIPVHEDQKQDLADIVKKFYCETLEDYIFPESKKVYLENYQGEEFNRIPFIKEPLVRDEFTAVMPSATVSDLVGYVSSWSGFQNFLKQVGKEKAYEVLQSFQQQILEAISSSLSPDSTQLQIHYKYFLLMGRKSHY